MDGTFGEAKCKYSAGVEYLKDSDKTKGALISYIQIILR
mgnify:CR=1 FL=1